MRKALRTVHIRRERLVNVAANVHMCTCMYMHWHVSSQQNALPPVVRLPLVSASLTCMYES